MPSRSFDYGQVESLVQDFYLPVVRDQYFFQNPIFQRLKGRARTYEGGRAIVAALSFSPEGGGGQWWSGVDKMDLRVRNPITSATFYRKNFSVPVVITRDEEDSVAGDTAIANLTDAKMQIARPTLVDGIGTAVFNAGTDPKQIGGLGLAIKKSPGTSHTYGGITTSSTVNTWWQNQSDVTGYITGGTGNTFAGVRGFGPIGKMWVKIGRNSGKRPTMILSNWGSYQDYHDSLAGVGIGSGSFQSGGQRYVQMDADLAKAGFENVMYKTAAWVVDERAPHDGSNLEDVFFIHEPALNLYIHSKRNMSQDGWYTPSDQRIRVMYLDWAGELVMVERRCHGVIGSVDTTLTS